MKVTVAFAVLMEYFRMLLMLLFVRQFSVAVEIMSSTAIPMILANAVGMAAFSIIVTDFLRRQKTECEE